MTIAGTITADLTVHHGSRRLRATNKAAVLSKPLVMKGGTCANLPKSEARQRRLAGAAATIQSLEIHFYFKKIEEESF